MEISRNFISVFNLALFLLPTAVFKLQVVRILLLFRYIFGSPIIDYIRTAKTKLQNLCSVEWSARSFFIPLLQCCCFLFLLWYKGLFAEHRENYIREPIGLIILKIVRNYRRNENISFSVTKSHYIVQREFELHYRIRNFNEVIVTAGLPSTSLIPNSRLDSQSKRTLKNPPAYQRA